MCRRIRVIMSMISLLHTTSQRVFSQRMWNPTVDGSFTVQLTHPCYVQFVDEVLHYREEIKGELSDGWVYDVSGLLTRKSFAWVSITGIDVDEDDNDFIVFHLAFLTEKLRAQLFQDIPTCTNHPVVSILTSSSELLLCQLLVSSFLYVLLLL